MHRQLYTEPVKEKNAVSFIFSILQPVLWTKCNIRYILNVF